jgi:hypothetical protein
MSILPTNRGDAVFRSKVIVALKPWPGDVSKMVIDP